MIQKVYFSFVWDDREVMRLVFLISIVGDPPSSRASFYILNKAKINKFVVMANGIISNIWCYFWTDCKIIYFIVLLLCVYLFRWASQIICTLNALKYTLWGLGNMYCVVEEIIVRMWLLYNPLLVDFKSNVVYRSFETVRKIRNFCKENWELYGFNMVSIIA